MHRRTRWFRPSRANRPCYVALVAAVCLSGILPARPTAGQDEIDQTFVESFEAMGRLPWYDAEADQVEAIPVSPRIDDSVNRNSRWVARPAAPRQAAAPRAAPAARQSLFGEYATVLGWVVVGLMLAGLAALLVWIFLKMDPDEFGASAGTGDADSDALDESDVARLENLPVDVRRPHGNLLAEADRLRQSGRLDEAIIYLFGHRLIQLDRAHAIRLTRGKTNRQYLRELRGRGELRAIMRDTVDLFERSYFGRYAIDPPRFDEVRGQQAEFEALLQGAREAA